MKRYLIILILMLIPINCLAYDKKEYIYTNLDTKGNEVEKVINNELKVKYKIIVI